MTIPDQRSALPTERTPPRTRWSLQLHDAFGVTRMLNLQVRCGYVYGALGHESMTKLSPEDVSRVRNALAEAQVEAFHQRGGW